jgi:hypothetical protein
MKKIIVVCAGFALALAAGMSHATQPGNNGGGNGGCGVGQTTNGCGGGSTPASNTNTAHGGAGGNGVGVGVGVGIGIGQGGNANATGGQGGAGGKGGDGGSVIGSGNSSNLNNNANSNKQGQAQGQKQGQQQGQAQSSKNSNRNDNKSSATGGNSSASNSNSNANSGNNSDQSVTVQGDSYEASRIPVATAYSTPLAASNGTCMGSSSAGFQGMAVGISVGTTWNDTSCDMRYDAEALRQAGMNQAAVARLCQKAEIAQAMKSAGTPCPGSSSPAATVATAESVTTKQDGSSPRYSGSDPVVRARLGLPPLK